MATRKKGGAKKTISTNPRGRKPKVTDNVDVLATDTHSSEDEVFNDFMLLLDKVEATSRTRILSRVTTTLLESKEYALRKAQEDFDAMKLFVNTYAGLPVDAPEVTNTTPEPGIVDIPVAVTSKYE